MHSLAKCLWFLLDLVFVVVVDDDHDVVVDENDSQC